MILTDAEREMVARFTAALDRQGFQIVPKEPTEAMLSAACRTLRLLGWESGGHDGMADAYKSAIAVAPRSST